MSPTARPLHEDAPAVAPAGAWTSRAGLAFPDLVPRARRAAWARAGLCPDDDLYTLFVRRVRAHPDRDALVDPVGVLDYAALHDLVLRWTARWARAGVRPRDVVALRLPNGRDAVAAELAVYACGAVALPVPPGGDDRDLRRLVERSRARAVVLPADERAALAAPLLPCAVLVPGAEDVPGTPSAPPQRCVDPYGPARILVSSGSEAEPTMVAYSHQALAGGRARYVRALHPETSVPPRHLVLVSLASSFGSLGTPVTLAVLGGTLVVQESFDPGDALRLVAAHRPTHLFGVPTMLRRIADLPRTAGEDLSSLRAVVSSGAALPASTALLCRSRFGRPVITVYGSSDGVNCHTAGERVPVAGSTGTPDPEVARIRITAPDGRVLPRGRAGQIEALGPMTPLCYVDAPELDARYRSPDGGWVRTGDLGRLDALGRLHVLGRSKRIVVRGGRNISAAEVEAELGTCPTIAEVACVPVPDADLGERLCACVRPAPGAAAPTLDTVVAHLRARGLARHKHPEHLLLVEEMPLGPTGKVSYRALAERAASGVPCGVPTGAPAPGRR
ncbi:class I adenylate-forming enzyme family protein [Streptomyces sp. NPDC002490]|uniref:class I adenylate-forming enzyme family protein n=1 Tax=Streptomyces sp. NPDC002490 TaxID=3154416 RepID=UPI00332742AA